MQNAKRKTQNNNVKLKIISSKTRYQRFSLFALRFTLSSGFTMVEVVVMLAIITLISAVVLFSFTGLNEGVALNRSAREVALTLRKAQNMSLAVTQITVGSPPSTRIPPAVGVQFIQGQSLYLLFADLTESRDNEYSGVSEQIGQSEILERGVRVDSLIDQNSTSHNLIHVIFAAPEASVIITDDFGVSIGNLLVIKLVSPSGKLSRTVTVRTSGQISIK